LYRAPGAIRIVAIAATLAILATMAGSCCGLFWQWSLTMAMSAIFREAGECRHRFASRSGTHAEVTPGRHHERAGFITEITELSSGDTAPHAVWVAAALGSSKTIR